MHAWYRPPVIAALLQSHKSSAEISRQVIQTLFDHKSHTGPAAFYVGKNALGWAIETGRNDVVEMVSVGVS